MNIVLHIERLVLDGLNVAAGDGALVGRSVEAELSRLLSEGALAPCLRSGGALPSISAGSIELDGNDNPSRLGLDIARSVYGAIGESK